METNAMEKALSTWTSTIQVTAVALLAAGGLLLNPGQAAAQFENKNMSIGELSNTYSEVGGETEYWRGGPYGLEWPAHREGSTMLRAQATWIAAKNVQGPEGETYPARVAHVGTRATGSGEMFPVEFKTVSRFPEPDVQVDGLPSYDKFPDIDEIDPNMKYDRKIVDRVNTILGLTMTREIYAFSQEDHDNYQVQAFTLTNTGNADEDEEIELDETLEGVYLHLQYRYTYGGAINVPGNEWGANVVNDIVGDGVQQYETDLRAQYTWLGNSPGADFDPLGGPVISDDHWFTQEGDSARLTTANHVGTATIHAPAEAGGPDADNLNSTSPEELQPSVTGQIGADHSLLSGNNAFDVPRMQREYEMLSGGWAEEENGGHMFPHHADLVDSDGDFTTPEDQGDPKQADSGGQQSFHSYGPYTLAPGESVTIVQVQAVDGLTRQEALQIGRGFVQNDLDPHAPITVERPDGPVSLGKNAWVMSTRDSLFQTFERATAAWEASDPPPRAPLPPRSFHVTSGVNSIDLSWEPMNEGPERAAWEIYRARNDWEGYIGNDYEYEKIATLDPGETSYTDSDVTRGVNYYYYITAVGNASDNDGSIMTNPGPLRSNRMYTQTFTGASLKKQPGTLSDAVIVPNPYVISAEDEVAWHERDRLGFLDIPGDCTIKIYTELGELVKTIEHTDGSGDEFWQLQTEDRQPVTSGVYVAVIENNDTGETAFKKFSVIR